MIKLIVNHKYDIEAANIIRLFYGKQQIEVIELEALEVHQSLFQLEDLLLYSLIERTGGSLSATARFRTNGTSGEFSESFEDLSEKQSKEAVKLTMYKLLSAHLGKQYPWGILTGIRPIKIVHELLDIGLSREEIKQIMSRRYLISDEKVNLSVEIALRERNFIYPLDSKLVSVYIGIPFCPTRCHYCSFTSNSMKQCGNLVEDYLIAMFHEMEQTKKLMNKYNLKTQTIYIGGGTPTSLNEDQLDRLLAKTMELFGEDAIEFTCEAGRPDTITKGKLIAMKQRGVTRISINPQTMNDETLERIGRAHSAEETNISFKLARELGFDNINMDIILGLPGEKLEHLENTLAAIEKLQPESLTVHTMALKRASILHECAEKEQTEGALQMMNSAAEYASRNRMHPYYLYRQKHMVENLENVGYCKAGYECIYNMQIIEEKQTNIAFGADAITKTVYLEENRIERQANIKDIRLYIARIDEQIAKKKQLLEELYENILLTP